MKRLAWCLVALMVPALASAQEDADSFINVVSGAPSYGGCTTDLGTLEDGGCLDLASDVPSAANGLVFVVASRLGGYDDGIGGVQWGLEHTLDGSWNLCTGGSQIPEAGWPASGTGNAATWAGGCYLPVSENAVVGFILLAPGFGGGGSINVTADPRLGLAQYTNCSAAGFDVPATNLGGDDDLADGTLDPTCVPTGTPTQEETWSSLKSLF